MGERRISAMYPLGETATQRRAAQGGTMAARTRFRPLTLVATAAALAAIGILTLNPGWVVGPLRGAFVGQLFELTGGRGAGIDFERALNIVLFVPLGGAVAAILPWRWGLLGIVAGLVVSTGVEVLQAAVPGRVSDPADILWNTAGAALGALVVFCVRALAAAVRGARRRVVTPRRA
jgi:hypothetical protein